MTNQNWTIEALKKELNSFSEIKDWRVCKKTTNRKERYFIKGNQENTVEIDQDRNSNIESINLWVAVHHKNDSSRQGEAGKKVFTTLALRPQIESIIQEALLTNLESWSLEKAPPNSVPSYPTSDPKIAEDIHKAMDDLTTTVNNLVTSNKETTFNSSEVFLSFHNKETHLSNGVAHEESSSEIYAESAFSFAKQNSQGEKVADEYLSHHWGVHLDDLNLNELFSQSSARAKNSLDVTKPKTGKYPVIIDADVLLMLFNDFIVHLSAGNQYNNLPFLPVGQDLIKDTKGDLITLSLDPELPFGGATTAMSVAGTIQSKLKLVDNNKVVATATSKQYADYLKTAVTTCNGNASVEAGKWTHKELTQVSPVVLEILQFSGLFTDANTGTFSSEIRLGKLYDNENNTVSYIKGGSLSGSLFENFKNARLSNNLVKRNEFSSFPYEHNIGYCGPDFALLSDVSIVG